MQVIAAPAPSLNSDLELLAFVAPLPLPRVPLAGSVPRRETEVAGFLSGVATPILRPLAYAPGRPIGLLTGETWAVPPFPASWSIQPV